VGCSRTGRNYDIDLQLHKLGRKLGHTIRISFGRSPLNNNIFSLDVPKLAQALEEGLGTLRESKKGGDSEKSYARDFRRLLRQSRNPTHRECEHDGEDPHPFWIFDFRFPIIGARIQKSIPQSFVHAVSQSKIAIPKLF